MRFFVNFAEKYDVIPGFGSQPGVDVCIND